MFPMQLFAFMVQEDNPMRDPIICPICGTETSASNLDEDVLQFIKQLEKKDILNEYLRVCKVHLDILDQGAPTAAVVTKAISTVRSEIQKIAKVELGQVSEIIPQQIQKALAEKMPDSDDIAMLINVLPQLTQTVQELLRKQEVPKIKGEKKERELADELGDYYPEDEIQRLGKSGTTDIIVRPLIDGIRIGLEVFIESKSSQTWSRAYVEQTRKHMAARGCRYAVLAVDKMPSGAKGFLVESTPDGTIFVADRQTCILAYGALKAVLVNEYKTGRRVIDLKTAMADKHIQESLASLFKTFDSIESIRKNTRKIVKSSKDIDEDLGDIEQIIKHGVEQIQRIINEAIEASLLGKKVEGELPSSPLSKPPGLNLED